MANSLRQPEKLSFDVNAPQNLYNILMECDFYPAAAHPEATGEANVSILLNVADRDAFEHSQKFAFVFEEECKNEKTWKEKFRELYSPLDKLKIMRHNFNTRAQQPWESFQAYLTTIKNKA